MTTYYVNAASGSDSNDGLSDSTPWKTIDKTKLGFDNGVVRHGDELLFNRGDTFYGVLNSFPSSTDPTLKLVIGAYGTGPRPVISGYKILNSTSSWVLHATGIWKADILTATNYTGYTGTVSCDVGFIKIDGQIYGGKKSALADVSAINDFYSDDAQFVYLRSDSNPASIHADIRVSVDKTGVIAAHNMVISSLDVVGFGAHGIRNPGVKNVEVVGCSVHETGGAYVSGTTRYGNGIEGWIKSENFYVHHNDIWDVYETATTLQGPQSVGSGAIAWTNCHFRFNRIWNAGQSFEVWGTGTSFTSADGFIRCSFTDNECYGSGRGWSQNYKSEAGIGADLLMYSMDLPTDITIKRNLFVGAKDCYLFRNTGGGAIPAGYVMDDNMIFLEAGTLVQWQTTQTIEAFSSWSTAVARDKASIAAVSTGVPTGPDGMWGQLADKALQGISRERISGRSVASAAAVSAQREATTANSQVTYAQIGPVIPMLSGKGYSGHNVSTIPNIAMTNGMMYGWRLVPGRTATLSSIGLYITTVGSTGSVIRLGIYDVTLGSTMAGTLVLDAGTIDGAAATGYVSKVISQVVRPGRQYVIVAASQGSPTTQPTVKFNQGQDPALTGSPSTSALSRVMGLQVSSGVTGALPSSATFIEAGDIPRVTIGVA